MALPALSDELVARVFDRCDDRTKAFALRRLSKAQRQRYNSCAVVRGPEPPPSWLFERWVTSADGGLSDEKLRAACDTVVAQYPRWMLQMMTDGGTARVSRAALCAVAAAGPLKDVKWARDRGCPWDAETCAAAAGAGNLAVLQWLRKHGCPWDGRTCDAATAGGHLRVLKWAAAHGCHLSGDTAFIAGHIGRVDIVNWMRKEDAEDQYWPTSMFGALHGGHVHVLTLAERWGMDTSILWDPMDAQEVSEHLAEHGHLEMLLTVHRCYGGTSWDETTCAAAATGGHLHVLEALRAQDPPCPWDERTCAQAAAGGRLEMLKWARAQDPPCPWDAWTCRYAAVGGHSEVLEWARANGCPE
jgi:hypothetical protein